MRLLAFFVLALCLFSCKAKEPVNGDASKENEEVLSPPVPGDIIKLKAKVVEVFEDAEGFAFVDSVVTTNVKV